MNDFPWYKMFPKDWLTSETIVSLNLEELGMFVTLLNNAWINDGLSPDKNVLMRLCYCDEQVFNRCWGSVRPLFDYDGKRLRNKKQEILREELNNIKKAKSKAGKMSGIARRKRIKKETNTCSTPVEHNSNKEETDTDKENKEKEFFEKFNSLAKKVSIPSITSLTKSRKLKLKKRFTEKEFDADKILDEISKSEFLQGKTKGSPWKVNFDWIIENDRNYIKILEGNYKNEGGYKNNSQPIRTQPAGVRMV